MAQYGVRTRNADGRLAVDVDETVLRYVTSRLFGPNFNGTYHVPRFSENRGWYFLEPLLYKFDNFGGRRVSDDTSLSVRGTSVRNRIAPSGRLSNRRPTLDWDEASKTMTVQTHSQTTGDWRIVFVHYK